ncbi:hypothetical protein UY3_03490 [Chelonia mydas]|uniref:Uncharacterized protein n=1 Tax=Chelonia mydas TaxID=8469 RepID=M7CES1_CHEMY|nr:hypothetical protein UY3_03490 [Chelonia mydas]
MHSLLVVWRSSESELHSSPVDGRFLWRTSTERPDVVMSAPGYQRGNVGERFCIRFGNSKNICNGLLPNRTSVNRGTSCPYLPCSVIRNEA